MKTQDKLPDFYLVTPDFDGDYDSYSKNLKGSLENGIRLVQLRSKNLSTDEYLALAKRILPIIRAYDAKVVLNGKSELLTFLDADGIHMPSSEYQKLTGRPIGKKYLLSVACHNKEQVNQAIKIKADFAVLCPIFSTPSSPKGVPIGWENFSKMLEDVSFPIYALGGLTVNDYNTAINHGAHGLAAKRALWGLKEKLQN